MRSTYKCAEVSSVKLRDMLFNLLNRKQEAIACYYGEKRPSRNQMRHDNAVSKAARLLRDYFWRGQQYGDATNPGSRFMRPFCQFITPSKRLILLQKQRKINNMTKASATRNLRLKASSCL